MLLTLISLVFRANSKVWRLFKGHLPLRGSLLALRGSFEMSGFEVNDRVLEKPLAISRYAGKTKATYSNDRVDITIENINFLNTIFFLNLKTDKKIL